MVSFPEAVRERDLNRYYQPWLDAQSLIDSADGLARGLTYEGYQPQASRDKALTAFAQLATLRLDTRRAMVSLIDSTRQYILAEATKTLSLFSPRAERPEDEMWLGNTIISRADAVCYHTFASTYTAWEEDGSEYTTECMIIPDCRQDARFADRDYVKGEPGVRFYAGVPITTKAGHQIGVYAVSDDRPRAGLSAADVRFMEEVAAAVMEHLELAKDKDDRTKGERMVRGLTQFIERSSMQEAQQESTNRQTTMEKQTENARLDALADDEPTSAVAPASSKLPSHKREDERGTDTSKIFQRAARIIKQSTYADGVVFFDTSAAGITSHVHERSSTLGSSDESTAHTATDLETADSTATTSRRKRKQQDSAESSANLADPSIAVTDFAANVPSTVESKPCPVVALALREGTMTLTERDFYFTEAGMERYIRKYPYGKFFNFSEEGAGINSSDERSERSETEQSDRATSGTAVKRTRKRRDRFIPTELLKVLPHIRSLIFLPLWDPASERWVAGGFIWTTAAGRLMSPENELPYLQAFGNCIISEVARLHAQRSDRAKTTFIASISHELRSPLHGILGSVEFLHDAVSSPYHDSLVSSIETCGKTLLDTIDHVLDYAKINKLRNASARRRQRGDGRQKKMPSDNSILGVTTDFNLAQLIEEVVDTVCAGHTFRKMHKIRSGAFHDLADRSSAHTMGGHDTDTPDAETDVQRVAVTLNVAPFVDWIVRSQPGALRRIIMNLLGNALKYTESGFITVTLLQSSSTSHAIVFTLSIEDSGKGMSDDYQRTRLFAPFSQEDPFSSGTGLGLSIVKQIVESLRGEIDVQSTLNVGTKIQVSLKLPVGHSENARTQQKLTQAPEVLKNTYANIVFPSESLGGGGNKIGESIRQACHGFGMQISHEFDSATAKSDFLLTEPSSLELILAKWTENQSDIQPLAVICICIDSTQKTAVEARISKLVASLGWVVNIVEQPCGPRKLARVLLDCQKRISKAGSEKALPRSTSTHPAQQASLTAPQIFVRRSKSGLVGEVSKNANTAPDMPSPLTSTSIPLTSPFTSCLSQSIELSPAISEPGQYFTPRVLLVDDNAINLKLLVVFAKRQNLPYTEATNGLEAFGKYKQNAQSSSPPSKPFDFVLMDLSMPIMDGLESTRQIRQFEKTNALERSTIVALTGLASAQDQQDALDAGVDMYLIKPVKFADIKRIFETK